MFLLGLTMFHGSLCAQMPDSIEIRLRENVAYLSDPARLGRKAGSQQEKEVASYLYRQLDEYGVTMLSPEEGEDFYMARDGDTLHSRNVIGIVEGYDPKLRDEYVVIGAHYDHMGVSTLKIDGHDVQQVYPGADDNASGVATLLEVAREVAGQNFLFRRSVIFAFFGAKEMGMAGSWYFLNRSFADVENIDAMINLDMLGTGYSGFYAFTSSNADMNSLIRTLSGDLHPIKPEIVSTEPYPSDHRSFYAQEIPSVLFTTGKYPEHNTEKDTQSIIDYEMMERELEYIYNFTLALANDPDAPMFFPDKVKGKNTKMDGVVSYYDCDQQPTFLGSPDPRKFLEQWVYQYLKYPAEAVRDGVQGRVMVEFVINKDGKVSDVRVQRGVSEELDAEAVKVVAASPKWKPGKVNGEKVRCSMTIPVEFRLEKKSGKPSFGIKK